MNSDFALFITSLFERSNLKNFEKFITPETLKMYKTAFTSKTVDLVNNYELFELLGDLYVNASIMKYLREWNPNIVSVMYLTRLKHNISSKKQLAEISEKAGFWTHIIVDEENRARFEAMAPEDRKENTDYMSLLEDVFEAFIGATAEIADKISGEGMGFIVCYKIIKSFLKEIHISLEHTDVFDAKTIFKELCDRRKWDFRKCFFSKEMKNAEGKREGFDVVCYGFPMGDRSSEYRNQVTLSRVFAKIKGTAENDACRQAIKMLRDRYNIYDVPPNPYERVCKLDYKTRMGVSD